MQLEKKRRQEQAAAKAKSAAEEVARVLELARAKEGSLKEGSVAPSETGEAAGPGSTAKPEARPEAKPHMTPGRVCFSSILALCVLPTAQGVQTLGRMGKFMSQLYASFWMACMTKDACPWAC